MTSDIESQIDSCLAYEVLRNPEDWLGGPSTMFLSALLSGAQMRADCVQPDFPEWRISGVLNELAFYQPFVDATGEPTLTIKWETALAMTHFSLAEGFSLLRNRALEWHRTHGVFVEEPDPNYLWPAIDIDEFWSKFAKWPAMYMGHASGWMLYCFLSGMRRGGDWLMLPDMPGLNVVFDGIQAVSEKAYGSPFAAFRVYDTDIQGLLKMSGLRAEAT